MGTETQDGTVTLTIEAFDDLVAKGEQAMRIKTALARLCPTCSGEGVLTRCAHDMEDRVNGDCHCAEGAPPCTNRTFHLEGI